MRTETTSLSETIKQLDAFVKARYLNVSANGTPLPFPHLEFASLSGDGTYLFSPADDWFYGNCHEALKNENIIDILFEEAYEHAKKHRSTFLEVIKHQSYPEAAAAELKSYMKVLFYLSTRAPFIESSLTSPMKDAHSCFQKPRSIPYYVFDITEETFSLGSGPPDYLLITNISLEDFHDILKTSSDALSIRDPQNAPLLHDNWSPPPYLIDRTVYVAKTYRGKPKDEIVVTSNMLNTMMASTLPLTDEMNRLFKDAISPLKILRAQHLFPSRELLVHTYDSLRRLLGQLSQFHTLAYSASSYFVGPADAGQQSYDSASRVDASAVRSGSSH